MAIGKSIKDQLENDKSVKLFGTNVEHSTAPVRILGGGGVIHDWYGTSHLQSRLNFVSENGALIAVGVPGFKTDEGRKIAAEGLSDIDLVTVRDSWSKERLRSVFNGPIHVTACPALLHDDPKVNHSGKTGVNFRPWFYLDADIMNYHFDYEPDLDHDHAKTNYLHNISRICDEVPEPVFIPFHEADEEFAREHLDIEILPFEFSVEQTLERVSSVDQMVAMRYHSLVFSIICNTPTMAIAYEPKVSYLADRAELPSYKPHKEIPIKFEYISNRDEIRESAKENFYLLQDTFGAQLVH